MARQTRRFPIDPRTHMIKLIAISGIPWAGGSEQLFAFSNDSFMFSSGLMHCTGEKSGLRSLLRPTLSRCELEKSWKEGINKFVNGPLWYFRSILTQKNLYLVLGRKPEINTLSICYDNNNQIREVGSHNSKYLPASNISFSNKCKYILHVVSLLG